MTQLYCYETELKPIHNSDIIEYFENYRSKFNQIVRYVWQIFNHNTELADPALKHKLNSHLQAKYNISTRGANSIISYVSGRYRSLLELKKTQLKSFKSEIDELRKDIADLSLMVNTLAKGAATNDLTEKQMKKIPKL